MSEKLALNMKKKEKEKVERLRTVEEMMGDLNHILQQQIEKQRLKSQGAIFDIAEVKVLGELTDAVVKLSREDRERLKNNEIEKTFKDMSTEQILDLLTSFIDSQELLTLLQAKVHKS